MEDQVVHDPERPNYTNALCLDCGVHTMMIGDYYTIHDELWLSVVDRLDGGMLCIDCLETRLGRRLNSLDFTGAPINHMDVVVKRSDTLKDRVNGDFDKWFQQMQKSS